MNPANDSNNATGNPLAANTQAVVSTTSVGSKEVEAQRVTGVEAVQEISHEVEISKEVKEAGVERVHGELIELPPDVKKLGVKPSGVSVPVATTTTLPKVVLPISDQQVVVGLHVQVVSSLRWLATWCIKKLKKAHIALKAIHGKIIRVRI